jgi:glyoxylase-like metal-dependent hydrolase (beta-lactamase superfamily II)
MMRAMIWLAAFFGLGLSIGVHAADTFGPASVLPEARSFQVGKLKLTVLHDAQYVVPNDAKTFGVDATPAAMSEVLRAAGAPTDRITLSVNVLLVHDGRRVVLIDTGLGPKAHGTLMASLGEAKVSPKAVTDILITHTHGDHTGGLLDENGHLAFPKATIRMASAEWAWMQKTGPQEVVKAISDHVRTFEPGAQVAPGVTAVALAGHTPGHVGYEIVSGDSHLLDVGDMVHSGRYSSTATRRSPRPRATTCWLDWPKISSWCMPLTSHSRESGTSSRKAMSLHGRHSFPSPTNNCSALGEG